MISPVLWQLLLQVILIGLNAIFACAEIAVISVSDTKLAQLVAQGDKRAIRLAQLTSQPARFLATIQVAITLSGFLGSAFAADNFSGMITTALSFLPIPTKVIQSFSLIVVTLVLSYFTLIFGELVPKRLAMKKAEQLALGMATLISVLSTLASPIVWVLTSSTNLVLRMFGLDPNAEEDEVSEEEIRMMVDAGSQKGVIDQEERQFIQNVFEFDDLTVGEFSTHRTDLVVLWLEENDEEWAEILRTTRFARYPVCDESTDNIVGILNVRDYFRLADRSRENVLKYAVKPAFFVSEHLKADVLFQQMKQTRNHFAVVLDEYGGVMGVVTMNDLLEQLVGDLEDDAEKPLEPVDIEPVNNKSWRIQGSASLKEVSRQLNLDLSEDELDTFDTFGGFVLGHYGFVPKDSDDLSVEIPPLRIAKGQVRDHRLEVAIVERIQPEAEASAQE
ncbi:MAG: hemolysin family protein [Candidatus Fournierella pullistercoris]|uniref:Hemolysin family protein n=1 Tax=Candidatus Allofournierella pullistercoris TaxID=2838597 RepID=A0A948WT49_9FIRM|nr:hemolysin family protein [Candidatus Fournierella pullistercoris]